MLTEVQNKKEVDVYNTNSLYTANIPITARMSSMAQKRTTNEEHILQTNRLENASKIPFSRCIEKRRAGKVSTKNGDSNSRKSRKHFFDMNEDAATEAMLQES